MVIACLALKPGSWALEFVFLLNILPAPKAMTAGFPWDELCVLGKGQRRTDFLGCGGGLCLCH